MDEKEKHYHEAAEKNFLMHHEIKNDAIKSINNIIFVVGTGTFVLSISIIGYFKTALAFPCLLIISWLCLLLAIIGNVAAQWYTVKASLRNQKLINQWINSGFKTPEKWNMDTSSDPEIKKFTRIGYKLSKWVVILLILGLFMLFAFVSINLIVQNKQYQRQEPFQKLHDDNNIYERFMFR